MNLVQLEESYVIKSNIIKCNILNIQDDFKSRVKINVNNLVEKQAKDRNREFKKKHK